MRFHKLKTRNEGDVWVDLDRVHAVKVGEHSDHAKLATPNGAVEVAVSVDDALALISPPAKPDTYEEELRTDKQLAEAMLRVRAKHDAATPQWVKDALTREEEARRAKNLETMKARGMPSSDRAARLDELERMMDALCYPGVVTYYHRRRKELA